MPRRVVFEEKADRIWVCRNIEKYDPLPQWPSRRPDNWVPNLRKLNQPQWFSEKYPYLGHIPQWLPVKSDEFVPLANNRLSSFRVNGAYQLDRNLLNFCVKLEDDLYKVIRLVEPDVPMLKIDPRVHEHWGRLRAVDGHWMFPHAHGYRSLHLHPEYSLEQAQRIVDQSWDAFSVLLGIAGFCRASLPYVIVDPRSKLKESQWLIALKRGGTDEWIKHMEEVVRFIRGETTPRTGVFLDLRRDHAIIDLFGSTCPIYYEWNSEIDSWVHETDFLASGTVQPTREELTDARVPDRRAEHRAPQPHEDSQQLRGESLDEFLVRRESAAKKAWRLATPIDRQRWQSRKSLWKKFPACIYGKKAPIVFEWTCEDGFWVRTRLTRAQVEDQKGDWGPDQVRYNEIFHQFDVYLPWGAPAENMDVDSDSEFSVIMIPPGTITPPYEGPDTPPPSADPSASSLPLPSADDDDRWREEMPILNRSEDAIRIPRLLDLLRYRFGLIVDSQRLLRGLTELPTEEQMEGIFMALGGVQDPKPTSREQRIIFLFFHQLIAFSGRFNGVDCPNMWDLCIPAQWSLAKRNATLFSSTTREPLDVRISYDRFRYRHYLLSFRGDRSPWTLCVREATSVLECQRLAMHFEPPMDSVRQIAEHLLRQGTPFLTLVAAGRPQKMPDEPPRLPPTGVRPFDWTPRRTDYHSHTAIMHKHMIRSKVRAALLYGGVIWRLTVDVVGMDVAGVLAGPSSRDAAKGGNIELDGEWWYDDVLSQHDIDIIIGRTYQSTCKSASHDSV